MKATIQRNLVDVLRGGRLLVSDGAWGTFLKVKGLRAGECPDLWSLDHPREVKAIAQAYLAAGADVVETNSFGANALQLEQFGLADRAGAINEAAARLSAEAAAEAGGDKWVIASVGPTGKLLMMGDVTVEAMSAAFREQATALARGGADAICIETMSDIQEALLALRAVKEHTACTAIVTFTFSKTRQGNYRTMMGVSPEAAASAMLGGGADIIGANCGNGSAGMVEIVQAMRAAAAGTPILVHANAGLPQQVNGVDLFPETPAEMAAQVPRLVEAGASIIGGCCGTTPAHIAAIREALRAMRS
jgi:5-methyltetrahydrofolate--homocysteine methyltransferase